MSKLQKLIERGTLYDIADAVCISKEDRSSKI